MQRIALRAPTRNRINRAATRLAARLRQSTGLALLACGIASTLGTTFVSAAVAHAGVVLHLAPRAPHWSEHERELLRSLSLASLGPLPPDPSNRYANDPRAAALGRELFFDTRLSGNGAVSCASCHVATDGFQDGRALGRGVGTTARRTMPIAGTAYSPWMFWDGRAGSQWEQALGPLESAVEHGGSRAQYTYAITEHHREEYERVFGRMPSLAGVPRHAGPVADTAWRGAWMRLTPVQQDDVSRVYANIGKAIAAYERRIQFAPSRFDRYVDDGLAGRPHGPASALSEDEEAGLRTFIGKGSCVNCHNGALLTDNSFHNTGVPLPRVALPPDSGRFTGVRQAQHGEFSCTSRYSDATQDDCEELRFAVTDGVALVRAYKTPSLRNVADRAPYMHAGQFATLEDVVTHYNRAPESPFGHSELKPLRLSPQEERQLVAFLRTLRSPITAPSDDVTTLQEPPPASSHAARYSPSR